MPAISSVDFGKEKLLVIAPHADDEVLGCFGLMNKIKENGGQVYVLVFTLGGYSKVGSGRLQKEQWKKEFLNASYETPEDKYKEKVNELLKTIQTAVKKARQTSDEFANANIDSEI